MMKVALAYTPLPPPLDLHRIKPVGLYRHRFQALYLFGIAPSATGKTHLKAGIEFNLAFF